jgi:hypothetical protein
VGKFFLFERTLFELSKKSSKNTAEILHTLHEHQAQSDHSNIQKQREILRDHTREGRVTYGRGELAPRRSSAECRSGGVVGAGAGLNPTGSWI